MRYLLALDDTDNSDSRGTGFRGRQLARWLSWRGLVEVHCISRHQLSKAKAITFTSQNSSVCLEISLDGSDADELWRACRQALAWLAAPGSQPGLCLAPLAEVTEPLQRFGMRCKQRPVQPTEAQGSVHEAIRWGSIDRIEWAQGQIGALAAVGLRASGQDGRIIWLPGLRSLRGVMTQEQLAANSGIQVARSIGGERPAAGERMLIEGWVRPLLRQNEPHLLVKRAQKGEVYEWELVERAEVKEIDQ